MGLGMTMVGGGCYNHGAPTELGQTRSALRSLPPMGQKPGRRTAPAAQILVALDRNVRFGVDQNEEADKNVRAPDPPGFGCREK